jgi:hypothetical protein
VAVAPRPHALTGTTPAVNASIAPRAGLLLGGGLCLLLGLDAALLRLQVVAPLRSDRVADVHGALMVLGFLGTLIALERAVALRSTWAYAAPALLAAGGLVLATPAPLALGQLLLADGAAVLVIVYIALWQRQRDDAVLVETLAAAMALIAALLWLRVDIVVLVPWLVGFLVLTIAAERVELARLTLPPTAGRTLVATALGVLAAQVLALLNPDLGTRLLGAVLLLLTCWLARHDVARRTIRSTGLPRYSAAALLLGYFWLLVASVLWLLDGAGLDDVAGSADGSTRDAALHAVFLGFTMSMVMAHAPVILPSVLRRPLPYRPALWGPLVLLHAALAVRVIAGLLGRQGPWVAASVLTVVALLAFVATAAWCTITGGRPRRPATVTTAEEAR